MYNVVVFGYNFTHKKSETFLHILKKNNINVVAYIAADAVKLSLPPKVYKNKVKDYIVYHPKELCQQYNIPFFQSKHNSQETLDIIKKVNGNLGIVSGARILSSNIIDMFSYGIVNFHPGKIPEASGLDGLLWTIYKDIKPFVTTHFIDKKIDAGKIIFENEVSIAKNDRLEDISRSFSLMEYSQLQKLLTEYIKSNKLIQSKSVENYKEANRPMDIETQNHVLKKFDTWKENIT